MSAPLPVMPPLEWELVTRDGERYSSRDTAWDAISAAEIHYGERLMVARVPAATLTIWHRGEQVCITPEPGARVFRQYRLSMPMTGTDADPSMYITHEAGQITADGHLSCRILGTNPHAQRHHPGADRD